MVETKEPTRSPNPQDEMGLQSNGAKRFDLQEVTVRKDGGPEEDLCPLRRLQFDLPSWWTQEDVLCESGSELTPDTKSSSSLILGFRPP